MHCSDQCIINYVFSISYVTLRVICNRIHSTLPNAWCILLQIALDSGFFLIEQTSFILSISNIPWKELHINLPLLSCIHHIGRWFVNLSWTCLAVIVNPNNLILISCSIDAWLCIELNFSANGPNLPRFYHVYCNFFPGVIHISGMACQLLILTIPALSAYWHGSTV